MTKSNDRIQQAIEYFNQGYNCAQSVTCAYCDLFGISVEEGYRMSSGFGGGVGGMRQICGTMSGATMLAGLKKGSYEPLDNKSKTELYKLVQTINNEFIEKYETNICKNLLMKAKASFSSEPSVRTKEYYKIRPCVRFVESACELVEKHILEK